MGIKGEILMLNDSVQRPAWLTDDLMAYKHRFITNRLERRIRLENYFIHSKGEHHCNKQCDMQER